LGSPHDLRGRRPKRVVEGGIFGTLAGRYAQMANLDFVNKAYFGERSKSTVATAPTSRSTSPMQSSIPKALE
jgi:hypothetical protein